MGIYDSEVDSRLKRFPKLQGVSLKEDSGSRFNKYKIPLEHSEVKISLSNLHNPFCNVCKISLTLSYFS